MYGAVKYQQSWLRKLKNWNREIHPCSQYLKKKKIPQLLHAGKYLKKQKCETTR